MAHFDTQKTVIYFLLSCITNAYIHTALPIKVYSIITLLLLFVFPLIILIITYSSAMERLQSEYCILDRKGSLRYLLFYSLLSLPALLSIERALSGVGDSFWIKAIQTHT